MKPHGWVQHGTPQEMLGRRLRSGETPLHPSAALSPPYMNVHVFHRLRKSPSNLGTCCSVAIAAAVLHGQSCQPGGSPGANSHLQAAAWAALPSLPIAFSPLHPRLSDARAATMLQSSPPSWVTPCSSSTSRCTSPRSDPEQTHGAGLLPSLSNGSAG